MPAEALKTTLLAALEDIKAIDTAVIDVRALTPLTDYIIITSGRSTRHVKAIADHALEAAKKNNVTPIGVEGEQGSEWILVDLGDVIVHAMQPVVREYYQLEKLWSVN
jgi:ribosome-associated protein